MTADIVGSKIPAKNAFGQNGDDSASSLMPGQSKPNIPKVSPPSASADAGDWQTREVSAEPIKTHPGALLRGTGGDLSGTVPPKVSR